MDDKFQTEPNALEPEFKEDNQLPTISVPQSPPQETAPAPESAQPEGNIQVPGVVVADEPEAVTPGWTSNDDEDGLAAMKQVMEYRKKRDDLGRVADSISNIVGYQKFKGQEVPIVGQDMANDVAQYRRDFFPTEEERQKGYLEGVGLGQINRGVGQSLELLGNSLTQAGVLSTGQYLKEQGQFWQAHTPKREAPQFTDVKNLRQGLTWFFEEAQVAIGQNVMTMGSAAVGAALGGPLGASAALGTVNLGMGVGEARSLAQQNFNEWENLAEKAEEEGRQVEARAFRQLAGQFDPDKPENLPVIAAAGSAIALLETVEDRMVWFKPLPESLKKAVKDRLYKAVVRHVAQSALQAGVTSSVTEAFQSVVTTFQDIKMKGAKEWIDYFDWTEQHRQDILNSAAAGFPGGAGISGITNVATIYSESRKSGSTGKPSEEESSSPMFDAVPPVAPEEAAPKEPVVLDDNVRAKFDAYLQDPAAVLSNKDRVSEALGIPKDQVTDYLDAAAEEGILTKIERKGVPSRYVRKQRVEPITPETREAAGEQFILPESANAATQETTQESDQSEMVPTASGETQVGMAQTAPDLTIDFAKQIPGLEAAIESNNQRVQEMRDEIKAAPKGQTIETRKRLDPEIKKLNAENLKLRKQLEELEEQQSRKVAQEQADQLKPKPVPLTKEERAQAEATTREEVAQHLPDVKDDEASRINDLVIDRGVPVEDALEATIKENVDRVANTIAAPTEQSPIYQERAGEGQRPAGEGPTAPVREGNAQPGQESPGGGLLTSKDLNSYAVFQNERAASARTWAQKIEERLRQGLGLTVEAKAERFVSKIKPLTKDGKTVNFEFFTNDASRLSPAQQAIVEEFKAGNNGKSPPAFYNPHTATVVVSLFAGAEAPTTKELINHEILHALVELGIVTREELQVLAKETDRLGIWSQSQQDYYTHNYRKDTAERRAERIIEEKAAWLIQVRTYQQDKASGTALENKTLIQDIIDRIMEVLENLRAAFRGEGDQERITWLDVIQTLVDAKIGSGAMGPHVTNEKAAWAASQVVQAVAGQSSAITSLDPIDDVVMRGSDLPDQAALRQLRDVLVTRERDLATRAFGSAEKAAQWERLNKRADTAYGAEADRIDAELARLNDEIVDEGALNEWENTPAIDQATLNDLIRTFGDFEANPNEIPDILSRYLVDLPPRNKPPAQWGYREKIARFVLQKAAVEAAKSGQDFRALTAAVKDKYASRFSDPDDAAFMLDTLEQTMQPRQPEPKRLEGKPSFAFGGENERTAGRVLSALDKAASEVAAQPAPVVGEKRPTISIPGLKRPLSPAEMSEARRKEQSVLGPLPPSPIVADMTGLPAVGFQADIRHILAKRGAKDDARFMKTPQSEQEVRDNISRVLEDPHFGYVYKTGNITLIHRTDEFDYVVAIKRKVSGFAEAGGQYLEIPTAFVLKKGQIDERLVTSLEEGGLDNLFWRKGATEIDRLLYIVRQARGPGRSPFISEAITELQKQQLALKGVSPALLASFASGSSADKVVGLNTIIRNLVDDLGITVNQGFGGPWGYKSRAGVIRQKAYYDLDTLSRNLGALMEARFDWVTPLQVLHDPELAPLDTIDMDSSQGFKEWVNLYISAPDKAQKAAPKFFEAFETEMEAKAPDYLRAIGTAQMALERYFDADPTASVESMITNAPRQTSMAKIKREIERDGVFNTIKHGILMAYKDTVSSEAPLSSIVRQMLRMEAATKGFKRMLPAINNAAKLYRLIPQAQQMASFDVERGIADYKTKQVVSPGLPEILREALGEDSATALNLEPGGIYSQFLGYLVSLRAAQLWRDYEAKKIPRPPTAVPEETILKAIKQYEEAHPSFKTAQAKLNVFTRALLKLKRDAGLITAEKYEQLKADKFYIPFQRSFDEEIKVAFEGGGGVNVEGILKKLKGSRRNIIDPMSMLVKDVYTTRQLIAINDVWKALIAQAEEAGPAAGEFVERVNPKKLAPEVVAVEEVLTNAAKEAGLSSSDTQSLMDTVTAELGSDALVTVFRQQTANTRGKPVALFMENGKLQALSVNDPVLAKMIFDSFQFLGQEHTGMLLNMLSAPTKLVRTTITTNPSFIIANAIRDAVFAPFHEFRMIPFWAQARGLSKIVRGDPILEEAMRAGMIMGGVGTSVLDQARLDQNIKQLIGRGYKVNTFGSISDFVASMKAQGATLGADGLKGSFERFQRFMEFSETASRIQLYEIAKQRALRNGLTEAQAQTEAALYANDYCDYSRNGSKIGPFRKMIEFFNAILQGLDRFRRTIAGSHDMESVWSAYYKYKTGKGPALTQDELRQLHQSTFAVLYSGVVIGGISVLVWSLYGDDERVKDVPAEIRRTHWVIPLGDVIHLVRKVHPGIADWLTEQGGERDLLRIPKPFDAAFLSNLVERYLWEAKKGDPNWVAKWLEDFTDTSLPPMFPTWMNIYSLSQGIDPQSGRPIETRQMQQNLAPPDRYTPFTSDFAKWWGEKTNSSPVQVDAMIKGLGTSWARDILNLNIPGSPWYNPDKPAKGLDEAFMLRRFLWQTGKMSETGRAFREAMGEENPLNTIMRKSMTTLNVYHPGNKLGFAAGSYAHRLDNTSLDNANKFLSDASPRERGYAILMRGLKGKDAKLEKLDPMNRASDIGLTAFQMQKELQSGTLRANKGLKGEKKQDLNANSRLSARDILVQLQWMEQHNALVLTQEIGYENREITDVKPLYDELKAVDPVIYAEFMKRLERKNVLPFAGIRSIWPELKSRLESDKLLTEAQMGKPEAVQGMVRDLWFKAKYPRNDSSEKKWDPPMRLGGPLPDTTTYEDGSRKPEFEKWDPQDRMGLNEDESDSALKAADQNYGKKMVVNPKPQPKEQGL